MKIIQCPSTTSSCSGTDTSLHILLSLFTISDKNQNSHNEKKGYNAVITYNVMSLWNLYL